VTASNGWRADELYTIDGCGEVDIATRRSDGTLPEPFTPDYLNDEKDTTWTRTPAGPR
jgi:hypothetical protein